MNPTKKLEAECSKVGFCYVKDFCDSRGYIVKDRKNRIKCESYEPTELEGGKN